MATPTQVPVVDEQAEADARAKADLQRLFPEHHDPSGNFNLFTPAPPSKNSTTNSVVIKPDESNSPALVDLSLGAIAGGVLGGRAPQYINPNLTSARANVAGANAGLQAAMENMIRESEIHRGALDAAIQEHEAAKIGLSDAARAAQEAEMHAIKHGIDITPVDELSGDKWNRKVVGDLGPGGKSSTEAAKNYRLQESLTPTEKNRFKASRSGLVVPNEPDIGTGPFLSDEQKIAKERLEQSRIAHATAQARVAETTANLESASRTPRTVSSAQNAANAARTTQATAQGTLAELEKARSFLSKIPYFNTLLGALSGAEAIHAYHLIKQGHTAEGVVNAIGAAGGLIGLVPHPATKIIGAGMSAIPLAYEGYKHLTAP